MDAQLAGLIVVPLLPGLIIFFSLLFVSVRTSRNALKKLTDKYPAKGVFPSNYVTGKRFRFGQLNFRKTSVKFAEKNHAIFIKPRFIDAIEIPYTEFKKIEITEGLFSSKYLTMDFKKTDMGSIAFLLKKNALFQMPELLKYKISKPTHDEIKNSFSSLKIDYTKNVRLFLKMFFYFVFIPMLAVAILFLVLTLI